MTQGDLFVAMEWGFKACERGLNIQAATAEFKRFLNPVKVGDVAKDDPVGEFHRQRGCCDGSDPSGCFRRQRETEEATTEEERQRRRIQRSGPRGEFEGTE